MEELGKTLKTILYCEVYDFFKYNLQKYLKCFKKKAKMLRF